MGESRTSSLPRVLRGGALAASFVLGIAGQTGSADARWKSIDVPGTFSTSPTAINDKGFVAGYYSPTDSGSDVSGFVRAPDGTFTSFDVGDDHHTYPVAINSGGVVAGQYGSFGAYHGFVRAADGTITTFDSNLADTMVRGINKKGVIVGPAFLRKANGKIKEFRVPDSSTDAYAINDEGIIAGSSRDRSGINHGFIRARDGTFTIFDISGVDNPDTLVPASINSGGEIAGSYVIGYDDYGFLRDAVGQTTTIDIANDGGTTVFAVNDGGSIVGKFDASGFLRTPDGQVTVLDYPGAYITTAVGINGKGEVVGFYTLNYSGWPQGFLWKP